MISNTMGYTELLLGRGNTTAKEMDFWTTMSVYDIVGRVTIYGLAEDSVPAHV